MLSSFWRNFCITGYFAPLMKGEPAACHCKIASPPLDGDAKTNVDVGLLSPQGSDGISSNLLC